MAIIMKGCPIKVAAVAAILALWGLGLAHNALASVTLVTTPLVTLVTAPWVTLVTAPWVTLVTAPWSPS